MSYVIAINERPQDEDAEGIRTEARLSSGNGLDQRHSNRGRFENTWYSRTGKPDSRERDKR